MSLEPLNVFTLAQHTRRMKLRKERLFKWAVFGILIAAASAVLAGFFWLMLVLGLAL